MIAFRKNLFNVPIVLLLFWAGTFLASSQESTYRGPFQIAGYEGRAEYQYLLQEGDTVKSGAFLLQKADLQSLLENGDTSFLIDGRFENDIPVGNWKFRFGSFNSGKGSELVDYQYRVLVNGLQEEAKGTLVEGRPNGKWTFEINRIENSEIAGTQFQSTIDFQSGIPQGSFQIEDSESNLVGRFLRNGLAHDQWTVFGGGAIEIEEDWYFEEGVLQRVVTKNDGVSNEWELTYDTGANLRAVPLDASYLEALRFQFGIEDSLAFLEGSLPRLLTQNTAFYQKMDTIFSALGATTFYPKWEAKLPYHPLDSLEQQAIGDIQDRVEKATVISEALLNSSQLNLLKRSDEEAAYGYAVVKALSEEWLKPLEKLKIYADLGVVDYIQRSRLMDEIWPNGSPDAKITLDAYLEEDVAERTFTLSQGEPIRWEGNDLRASGEIARYALSSLQTIEKRLRLKLGQQQSQQELSKLEERLIGINDSLQSYIDSVASELPKAHQKALENVKNFAEKKLSDYAAVPETPQKQETAKQLVGCFEALRQLGRAVGTLPQQADSIQKIYVDGVWNPFVAVVMEEEVKKRITTAYNKVLVPYYLELVTTSLQCETAAPLHERIGETFQRMLALRDEETKRLERKLRKENDPETVLKLFNLENKDLKN